MVLVDKGMLSSSCIFMGSKERGKAIYFYSSESIPILNSAKLPERSSKVNRDPTLFIQYYHRNKSLIPLATGKNQPLTELASDRMPDSAFHSVLLDLHRSPFDHRISLRTYCQSDNDSASQTFRRMLPTIHTSKCKK